MTVYHVNYYTSTAVIVLHNQLLLFWAGEKTQYFFSTLDNDYSCAARPFSWAPKVC